MTLPLVVECSLLSPSLSLSLSLSLPLSLSLSLSLFTESDRGSHGSYSNQMQDPKENVCVAVSLRTWKRVRRLRGIEDMERKMEKREYSERNKGEVGGDCEDRGACQRAKGE